MKTGFFKRLSEKISVFVARKPAKAILIGILIFNALFFCLAAFLISRLAPQSLQESGFWASLFYTVAMILDAGCIQFVVADVGQVGVLIIIICLAIVFVGMISFTGAIIGYLTNSFSSFIENAYSGAKKLRISNHTIILNWNTRASEIINDLLYSESKEKIVVLVNSGKDKIEREISDRISDTIAREYKELLKQTGNMSFFKKWYYIGKHILKNNLTVIVKEGNVYSTKSLNDISVANAKSVIILGSDINTPECRLDQQELLAKRGDGNSNTVKILIQLAELTGSEESADNQKIVVEVEDDWTRDLVDKIIKHKENLGKCNIVPVHINRILGRLLAQFSVMPELNFVYNELFSNKGAFFVSQKLESDHPECEYIQNCLNLNSESIPLAILKTKEGYESFFMVDSLKALKKEKPKKSEFECRLNSDYKMPQKNILILGHNSEMLSIMEGFDSFLSEWTGANILNVMIIDEKESLERNNYFKGFPYVKNYIEANIYEKGKIYPKITDFVDSCQGEVSILILSDDLANTDEIDAKALTYLIYVNELIYDRMSNKSDNDKNKINVIVEVINPQNSDVVKNYSVNNVVISNRYLSKMITQIGAREAIFDFYRDILTYDSGGSGGFKSKELYIKRAGDFFEEIPGRCTAFDLIRGVFEAGPDYNKSLILGYIRNEKEKIIFGGDQEKIIVELKADDKLIIFSNH